MKGLLDRLRGTGCDRAPFTPDHAECVCRLTNEAADEIERLRSVAYDMAHKAATLGSGSDGWLRGRFMSISNALNAAIGRQQSSHGDQYDAAGKIIRRDQFTESTDEVA